MKQFLTSTWKNIYLQTWIIEPEMLQEHLPHKFGLLSHNQKALVSLVAYHFEGTKVKGIKMPFHVQFPELDLRFYVQNKDGEGVSFIKQYVPRYCVSLWANRIFNEHYETLPMEYINTSTETSEVVEYKIWNNKKEYSIKALASKEEEPLDFQLLRDLKWGYNNDRFGNPMRYYIEQDISNCLPIVDKVINIDYSVLFGSKWRILNYIEPEHTCLIQQSAVKIYQPEVFIGEHYQKTSIVNEELVVKNFKSKLN